ncbi:hypothetical protein [Microbispora catharanthi]|uniref:Uncharacterized protein n=1 Tax=Microbispora catharanthi TaxID=1712871 RepID=A0A5N6AVZ9_9ACTN|nr:hypothetical protein [Microbispora catharanthi]KAB8172242.1 hypothetical protein FH610_042500 [Microbispora catharanthi]
MPHDANALPGAWSYLGDDQEQRRKLEAELVTECGSDKHPMFGQRVEAVARCGTCDDVLLKLVDQPGWAIVHLTWRRETNPSWPSCEVMESWSSVLEEMIDRGH